MTRLPHGYMKQNQDNTRTLREETVREGNKNIGRRIEHTSKYVVKLRVEEPCSQVIAK